MDERRARRCPTCRAEVAPDAPAFPFCGDRCRLADLGGWLDERYRITGSDEEDLDRRDE